MLPRLPRRFEFAERDIDVRPEDQSLFRQSSFPFSEAADHSNSLPEFVRTAWLDFDHPASRGLGIWPVHPDNCCSTDFAGKCHLGQRDTPVRLR